MKSIADFKPTGDDLNIPDLNRQFDRTKAQLFMGKNAAFFGSLLCSMNFYWTWDHPTAATDGKYLIWNPYWFTKIPEATRVAVLMHELWHPALLHSIRRGTREPDLWNQACDHKINLDLVAAGFTFSGLDFKPCCDPRFKGMVEEDIYDVLEQETPAKLPPELSDLLEGLEGTDPSAAQHEAVGKVVQAQQVADLAGEGSPFDAKMETILKQFLAPIVPWEQKLHRFMQDLVKKGRTWNRPNRRYPDLYLPSPYMTREQLQHLVFFEDVSGSISDKDALRFNSEVKYVWDKFKPEKLTLVQFDDQITQEVVFNKGDKIEQIKIIGRGGTDLRPVRQWIIEHRPTAVVVFSDLYCAPMEKLPFDIPTIWVAISNQGAQINFGEICHIRG